MVKLWKKTRSEEIGDFRIFRARWDTSISPRTGQEHRFIVLDSPDWINLIPLTPEGSVVFVQQYRHGTEELTLEVVGGLVDPGETPEEAAVRELMEETGYEPTAVHRLGHVAPNPAFLNNTCYSFLATGVQCVTTPRFDSAEDISLVELPLDEVTGLIMNGRITHSLTINAFYFLDQFRRAHPDLFSFAP